ncbi:MAG: hypothetical protein HGA61_03850 [Candidatus Moranbacteria bacterium]|nr:hypothetical protein [Candidatus Moranbacteria bacterium]
MPKPIKKVLLDKIEIIVPVKIIPIETSISHGIVEIFFSILFLSQNKSATLQRIKSSKKFVGMLKNLNLKR